MRAFLAMAACLVVCLTGCSGSSQPVRPYGAQGARLGESLALLGWNMAVSNLRWDGDYVLDRRRRLARRTRSRPHAKPEDIRFGLYGALSHPMESDGLGSCDRVTAKVRDVPSPLSAAGDRLTGTVCLGPLKDRSQVRGVYSYSPRDRIPNTSSAYPAAFPVGLMPTNANDTGLVVKTTSLSAWRADGAPMTKAQLGDPAAFNGNGYMLLGLEADAVAARYRDDSAKRGGPLMLLASPTVPGRGLNPACAAYGSSVLILPDAVAGRGARQRVVVHSGRNQRGVALRDGGDRRHARRGVDAAMSEPGPTEWVTPAGGVGPWTGELPDDPRYDPVLLREGDTRNVVDAYRYWTREAIIADIDRRRHPLHVAIENFGHDANIGSVVRTANAFAVHTVHIVGRRRWNRRGAMVTDRYQRLRHHDNTAELLGFAGGAGLTVVAVDNVPGAARLEETALPRECLLVFGQEGPGITDDIRAGAAMTVSIAQFGSTRSINAGVAAGIAMHAWIRQHADMTQAW